ncbi:hypothetical protein CLD22_26110, partial [Rubrivivax gelatinosus]|nr:hypothetical protein [Rubrivivax gelatinosus]
EGVTAAALQLQRQGLIRYSRGRIQVLDRRGLEQQCCECYRAVERAYEQLRSELAAQADAPAARDRAAPRRRESAVPCADEEAR